MIATSFTYAFALTALLELTVSASLLLAWKTIHSHPHVQPLDEVISADIALHLKTIIAKISNLAGIETPNIYICRAELPNAFAVASIMRTELFLTDELLEEANNKENKLEYLTMVLCHEIAHIQHNHSLEPGLWTYGFKVGIFFRVQAIHRYCKNRLIRLEDQADISAKALYEKML